MKAIAPNGLPDVRLYVFDNMREAFAFEAGVVSAGSDLRTGCGATSDVAYVIVVDDESGEFEFTRIDYRGDFLFAQE